jgi:hypothetical protein
MQTYNGPIETLEHARAAGRALMANCACGWMIGFDPYELMCKTKRNAKIADVGRRLRCKKCRTLGMRLEYRRNFIERAIEIREGRKRSRPPPAPMIPVEIEYADYLPVREKFSR